MPSSKKKAQARQQKRLGTLNPTTLNVIGTSPDTKPTPEAAAAAASQRQEIWAAAVPKESSVAVVSNDEVLEARKTEVLALPTFADTTGLKPAAEEVKGLLANKGRRPQGVKGPSPELAWPPQVGSYLIVRTCGREPSWDSRYVQQRR